MWVVRGRRSVRPLRVWADQPWFSRAKASAIGHTQASERSQMSVGIVRSDDEVSVESHDGVEFAA